MPIKSIKIYCQLLNTSLENLALVLKTPSYLPQIWLEAVIHHSECCSALAHTCVHHCRAAMCLPRERDRQPELLPDGNSEKDAINPVTRDVLKPWLVKVGNKWCNWVHLHATSVTNVRQLKERDVQPFWEVKSYCIRAQRTREGTSKHRE